MNKIDYVQLNIIQFSVSLISCLLCRLKSNRQSGCGRVFGKHFVFHWIISTHSVWTFCFPDAIMTTSVGSKFSALHFSNPPSLSEKTTRQLVLCKCTCNCALWPNLVKLRLKQSNPNTHSILLSTLMINLTDSTFV